jgi:hypothetical protein
MDVECLCWACGFVSRQCLIRRVQFVQIIIRRLGEIHIGDGLAARPLLSDSPEMGLAEDFSFCATIMY